MFYQLSCEVYFWLKKEFEYYINVTMVMQIMYVFNLLGDAINMKPSNRHIVLSEWEENVEFDDDDPDFCVGSTLEKNLNEVIYKGKFSH